MSNFELEPMLDLFVFETMQLSEQLEQIIINCESTGSYSSGAIGEVFRIMHTIKGSSAMMQFHEVSSLAHAVEDMFQLLREDNSVIIDYSKLSDVLLEGIDFIRIEMQKIKNGDLPDGQSGTLVNKLKVFLAHSQEEDQQAEAYDRHYKAVVYFDPDCKMENVRAFNIIHNLKNIAHSISYLPENILEEDSIQTIQKEGFQLWFAADSSYEKMNEFFSKTIFLNDLELVELKQEQVAQSSEEKGGVMDEAELKAKEIPEAVSHQSIISVNVSKLDKLMDLVGELVVSEAMLTRSTKLEDLASDFYAKAARQHRKIIHELQDVAMSIRMVPISATLQKMNRIVRDMSRKLSKKVRLEIVGEETEVDKNIIERISDPLMHMIRNAIDHGIEPAQERLAKGKPELAVITLEARNSGGDVLISVRDDGKGLDRDRILAKAREVGLISRPDNEISDKEVYSCIFLPGFSTNQTVTEFSGRGVGMDVVTKNIGAIGGTVTVDSVRDKGTVITMKLPLTLAIIEGMIIRVGNARYTIPIINIREAFKAKEEDVFTNPEGIEMLLSRNACHPIIRLHQLYKVETSVTDISEGMILMVEDEDKTLCIFADGLIGQQQVVVKSLPEYIKGFRKAKGVSGCTLLSDGGISLILDVADLQNT